MSDSQSLFRRLDDLGSHRWLLLAGLFAAAASVFLATKPSFSDSSYAMLVSESLLHRGSFVLDPYFPESAMPLDPHDYPGVRDGGLPYQIREVDGHLRYYFPTATSVLSVPFVAVLNVFGVSAVDEEGRYHKRGDRRIQRVLAALLMAGFTVVVFEMARILLPVRWSLVVAGAVAFGTPVWSTASRALWSHTWALLLVGIAAYQLLLAEAESRERPRGFLLGTLLAWAYFVRPTASIAVVVVGVYLLLRLRAWLPGYAAALVAWGLGFVTWSRHAFDAWLPPYFQPGCLTGESFWTALAGNLFSPARGLLVFVPSLLVIGALLVRYRSRVERRPLLLASLAVVLLQWLVVSGFPHWWAGHSYGPRLMTETLPWLTLAAVLAVHAWLSNAPGDGSRRQRACRSLAAALVLASVFIHGGGVIGHNAWNWNSRPVDVDVDASRLWDWSDPQFLAWLLPRPAGPEDAAR